MSDVKHPRSIQDELDSLENYIESFSDADAALVNLTSRENDPVAVRRALLILIETGRAEEAANLVRKKKIEVEWCDIATLAYCKGEDWKSALSVVNSARELGDPLAWHRCCLYFAQFRAQEVISYSLRITAEETRRDWKSDVIEALDVLSPVLATIIGKNQVKSELEANCVAVGIHLNLCINDTTEAKRLVELVETKQPVAHQLISLVMTEKIVAPTNLVTRIRSDYPDSFESLLNAAFIESFALEQTRAAFDNAKGLISMAADDNEKSELCKALFEFAQDGGTDQMTEAVDIAKQLLGEDNALTMQFIAASHLQEGRLDEAWEALEDLPEQDDPLTLQLAASYWVAKNDNQKAIDCLVRASEQVASSRIYRSLARLYFELGQVNRMEWALRKAVSVKPNNSDIRHKLVGALLNQSKYEEAAEQLQVLSNAGDASLDDELNLVSCLANSGNIEAAISTVEKTIADEPPAHAIFLASELYKANERASDALTLFECHLERFWDMPEYLLATMEAGYSAGNEALSHKVLLRLQELRQQGLVDEKMFRPVEMDELKDHAKDYVERERLAFENISRGQMPWIMASASLNKNILFDWFVKTQPLDTDPDHLASRAQYCIYSTNGFTAIRNSDGRDMLDHLTPAAPNEQIAIDISAIFTLDQLELLDVIEEYFSQILYPSAYLESVIPDAVRLKPHQKTHAVSLTRIREAVDDQKIGITRNLDDASISIIDEYNILGDDINKSSGLKNIVETMTEYGLLTNEQKRAVEPSIHRDKSENPPGIGEEVCIHVTSLKTLIDHDLMEPFLRAFDVHISREDWDEIRRESKAFAFQNNVSVCHERLWRKVRGSSVFVPRIVNASSTKELEQTELRHERSLAAAYLAMDLHIPLLVDDRVPQSLVLNTDESLGKGRNAFDTSALLRSLSDNGFISEGQHSDAVLKLMQWRYRFIVPRSKTLIELLLPYVAAPPGNNLQQVANYCHSCMRDNGLFGGAEKVDPPIPLAMKLFQEWTRVIGEFVVDVWFDERVSERSARKVTDWALTQFLPSVPSVLNSRLQVTLAQQTNRTLITFALLRCGESTDAKKGNAALTAISTALNLSKTEYLEIVMAVIGDD